MSRENSDVLDYLATLNRMEKDIAPVDTIASLVSIAISLKRIADHLEVLANRPHIDRNDLYGMTNNIASAINSHSVKVHYPR